MMHESTHRLGGVPYLGLAMVGSMHHSARGRLRTRGSLSGRWCSAQRCRLHARHGTTHRTPSNQWVLWIWQGQPG